MVHDPSTQIQVASASIGPDQAIAAHLAALVHRRLNQLDEKRHFERAKDPVDALHDLRVASRRLQAFVDVFNPILEPRATREVHKRLREITRAARAVRDLDVQLGMLRDYYTRTNADIERVAIEELVARTLDRKNHEMRRVRKRLKALKWKGIDESVSQLLGTAVTHLPSTQHAMSHLAKHLLEPLAQLPYVQAGEDAEKPKELHTLRVSVKKLRYALELFEPLLGDAFHTFYEPVESLQELLGRHHDLFVLEGFVRRQRRALEDQRRPTLAQAMRAFEVRLAEHRHAVYHSFRVRGFDFDGWQHALLAQLEQVSGP